MKSTQQDQPIHVAGESVDLACLEMKASLSNGALDVALTDVPLRECKMDEYGTAYLFRMPKTDAAKAWFDSRLSRLNFGLDNFDVNVNVQQCFLTKRDKSHPLPIDRPEFALTMEVSARVWCWKADIDLAEVALKKAIFQTLDQLNGQVKTMGLEVVAAETQPGKVPPSPKPR